MASGVRGERLRLEVARHAISGMCGDRRGMPFLAIAAAPRERLLRALLGHVPVAGPPDQGGHDAAPLLAEGRIYRVLNGRRGHSL